MDRGEHGRVTDNDPSKFQVKLDLDGSIITVEEGVVTATKLRGLSFEKNKQITLTFSGDTENIVSLSKDSKDKKSEETVNKATLSEGSGENKPAETVQEDSQP